MEAFFSSFGIVLFLSGLFYACGVAVRLSYIGVVDVHVDIILMIGKNYYLLI